MDLRVGMLEGDVAEPLGLGELAGTLDGGCGDVDPERAARLSPARGLPGRLPGPASDVEDVVAVLDAAGPAQCLVMPPQFGVVAARVQALLVIGVLHVRHPASSWRGGSSSPHHPPRVIRADLTREIIDGKAAQGPDRDTRGRPRLN